MVEVQKLYVHPGCPNCWKVLIMAEFVGCADTLTFLTAEDQKNSEYLEVNPHGSVPTLYSSKGSVYESNAILRALARAHPHKKLYGKSSFDQARVDQWLDWTSNELAGAVNGTHGAVTGTKICDEKTFNANLETLKNKIHIVEQHLANNQFLVGDSITIADIALVARTRGPAGTIFDAEFRKGYPNFFNYFHAVSSLPEVMKALGRVRYAEKRWALAVAPKKEEVKKEEKKPAAAKPKKKDDDEDEEEEEKPKKDDGKAELDSLPPSPFNFYDFKTLISNAPNKADAVKEFWNQFDPNGYSLWFIEYEKAPGEGKVVYLTNNLMNGFLQRLDHFRKYCYGVYGVYGDEPNLEVRGVFCWRGNFIPQLVKQHDQYDYHKFTQLDHTKEADRKKVEEFWTKFNEDEDVVDGLTARTVKYFK